MMHIHYVAERTPDITMTYDAAGNMASMTDGLGTFTFAYTAANRLAELARTINGVTYTTGYGYDNLGNLATLTYPSGRVVTYGYDAGNRVNRVNGFVTDMAYHPSDVPSRMRFANGATTTLALDALQRPVQLHANGIMDLAYAYDPVGNVTSVQDRLRAANSMNLTYDALDRLTKASGAWGSLAYTYNEAGDRTTVQHDGMTTTYEMNPNSGQLQRLTGGVNLDFQYDFAGNVLRRGSFEYDYDVLNRVHGVQKIDASGERRSVTNFAYDGLGRRAQEQRPGCGSGTLTHYDNGGNHIAESTAGGLFLKEYILLNGRTIAEIDLTPVTLDTPVVALGEVEIGAEATSVITLTNRATQPVTLTNSVTANGILTPTMSLPTTLAPKASSPVTIRFTAIETGLHEETLYLCDSYGQQWAVQVNVRVINPRVAHQRASQWQHHRAGRAHHGHLPSAPQSRIGDALLLCCSQHDDGAVPHGDER